MINLYKKDETSFGHNGIGSLDKNILNPEVSWKDNGAFTLEFKYPLFAKHGFEIENSSIVRANDPEGSNLFFVYKITPSMGYVTVLCYQISYKLAFNSINDTNIVNKNGQNALTQMSSSTQYPHSFVFSSDILTTATSRVVRKNPIEFLLDTGLDNSFVNRWGGHIVRHNFNISMNSAYGSNKGYTIRHKKDLKGYEAEFDESTVITRIRPVGYDGLLLPETYVDSPLLNAYPEPRIQEIEYSDVKVKTKDGDEEGFSTTELAYAELRRLANLEFSENKVDLPTFTCKVEFVNLKDTAEYKDLKSLKQILAGDIVKVVHSEDNFSIEAQMVEYKYNPLNNSYISITLGNYTKSFTSTVGKSLQTNLNQVAQQAQSAWSAANGKNTIYSLTYKPAITNSSTEGDLLYLKNGDKTELWILEKVNGKLQWVLQVSDATQEELKAQMQQAQNDIKDAVDSANNAVDKANTSVTAVQANTQLITDVNAIANNAKTHAQTAITNAQTALTSANTAKTNAQTALDNVGKLSEDVSTLNTIANQAKSDADTALINANKGITDAKTALNKAIGVDTRVTTEITNVNNTLATKANSTTLNAIKGTVDSQGTAISQNATDIKLKADSTVVNAIKGTVDSQGTLISQNSKDIALKANKSSVDTLTGRVSANETAIDVTSQGVSTLVTKTDGTNTSLSQFKQDYEGFKGTVYTKSQTDTKVSTVQQSVDNFKTTVSNTYSSKTETDNKVTAVQANVDKIGNYTAYANSADGTDRFTTTYPNLNLLTDSREFKNKNVAESITTTSITSPDSTIVKEGNDTYLKFIKSTQHQDWFRAYLNRRTKSPNFTNVDIKGNTKYTFSVWLKGTGTHTLISYDSWTNPINAGQSVTLTSDWKLYTFTVLSRLTADLPNDKMVQFFIRSGTVGSEINLKYPKVEEGSTATPYMQSEKEQTSNDIPKYVGYSVRQSENPKDFSWQPYSGLNSYKIIEATTSIEQNSKDIALKASKSEVDTLSGKVLATESSVKIQDGQISALNTKTDGHTTQIGTLESSYNGLTSTISKIQTDVGGKAGKTELSQLSQDLSGFKTTVSNTYLSKSDASGTYADKVSVASQINQSATEITSNVQSWANNKLTAYSTIQQTATSITNAVASKADKSQITQLSNQITSVVTDVSAIQVGGQNLLLGTATAKTSTITQTNSFTTSDPYNFSVSKFSAFNFEVDDYIILSFDWETTSTTGDIRPEINSTPYGFGTVISAKGTNGATSITKTINASEQRGHIEIVFKVSSTVKVSEASKLRLRFDNHQLNSTFTIKNAKLEKGNKATDWCIAPQEVANQSQITQLSTDINLRVSKGDVTSQINIEAGRTLIDTKQLLLNADNVKFSGSAFIPNSVIQNLSADKITAGTLNAANVNVINLNAANITTGTLSGSNLSMNLNTGAVQFKKGYIEGSDGRIRFDLDKNYFQSLNWSNNGFVVSDGSFTFYQGFFGATETKIGGLSGDIIAEKGGIILHGVGGASLSSDTYKASVDVGSAGLGTGNGVSIMGDTRFWGGISVLGKKNAIHVTRDGVRETPAYETAESYLGDIGGNYTRENCEVWVDIEKLFSDTVNTDIAYHVFLQAYDDARFWVEDFRSDKFLIKSDKPMARFAWEIKAKRRGYENDRLVMQEGFDNKMLLDAQSKGVFKGDGENE